MGEWMDANEATEYLQALGVNIAAKTVRRAMRDGRIQTEIEEPHDVYTHRETACCHVRDALEAGRIRGS